MYDLMIIDDELSTIHGLKKHVDWESYGIKIIATASSGNEALEKIYKYKPQIVISDIKMPELTGLELAKIIKKDMPETKFLFISGYDDMEFINSAFSVNASNYILKPINLTALTECIEQIIKSLKSEEEEKAHALKMEMQMFHSLPLLHDRFFKRLVCGNMSDRDINKQLELLNLDFNSQESYFVVICNIDDYKKTFSTQSERDKNNNIFSILNISKELLTEACKVHVMTNSPNEIMFIIQADKYDTFYPILQNIQTKILEILSISLTIGIGEKVTGIENLPKSYMGAMNAISKKIIHGKKQIITAENFEANNLVQLKSYVLIDVDDLLEALKIADKSKIEKIIRSIFNQLLNTDLTRLNQIQYINYQLVLCATNFSVTHMCFSDDIQELKNNSLDLLEKIETLDEMQEIILQYYFSVCDAYSQKKSDKFSELILQIQNIIKSRYYENITIKDIADEVFLTPTYICLLFKQETGMTINEYLTQTRIEVSKELIADKSNKLTDIAYLVGYADSSYFTKQFKKNTGFTPKEYRNNIKQSE
ncbi:MAG: AraC family transcriptional regulator [Clostridia bacterium]|nr:AraC family transcriptional regulator [Clostridia bacterium]